MTLMAPRYKGQLQNPQLWGDMSFIVAGMMILFSVLAMIGISGRDVKANYESRKAQKIGFRDMVEVIRKNRALQMLVISASTDKLAIQLMNGMTVYIFSNCFLNNAMQGTYSSIKVWPVLVISMSGIFLARRFGLKKPFVAASWASMACLVAMFFIGAKPSTMYLFLVIYALQQCMTGITNNIQNPMIADCADYEMARSGKCIPGIVGTIFTFVDKIISSLASTIMGFALAFAGVSRGQIKTNTFISDRFYMVVMVCFCLIPILGHIATIIAMKFYPLTREKMIEIEAEIAKA